MDRPISPDCPAGASSVLPCISTPAPHERRRIQILDGCRAREEPPGLAGDGRPVASSGDRRGARALGDGRGPARAVRARRAGGGGLRGPSAADRGRPDHLGAGHRGHDGLRLGLTGDERVLEVGGGSGYAAAVLSRMAREVVTIERHPDLAERARSVLSDLGYDNVEVRCADGTQGAPDRAPFEAITVAAMAREVRRRVARPAHSGRRPGLPRRWGELRRAGPPPAGSAREPAAGPFVRSSSDP